MNNLEARIIARLNRRCTICGSYDRGPNRLLLNVLRGQNVNNPKDWAVVCLGRHSIGKWRI